MISLYLCVLHNNSELILVRATGNAVLIGNRSAESLIAKSRHDDVRRDYGLVAPAYPPPVLKAKVKSALTASAL